MVNLFVLERKNKSKKTNTSKISKKNLKVKLKKKSRKLY